MNREGKILRIESWGFVLFWPCCATCGTLVPQLGFEPMPPELGVGILKHQTTKEVLESWIK